jgi:hypothetical protein
MQRGRNVQLALLTGAVAVAGLMARPAQAAAPAVKATGLPAGWEAANLGGEEDLQLDQQSVTVADGKWTIVAGGKDLWNAQDGGLIVYTKHTGNGSVSFRLLSQTGGADGGWVKTAAGFRESTAAGARDVHVSATSGNSLEPAVRTTADEQPLHPGENGSTANGTGLEGNGSDTRQPAGRPIGDGIWVGIEREGNVFRTFGSNDGKVWNKLSGVELLDMPEELLAGIEATAHKDDPTDSSIAPQTSVLDNVSVSNELLSPRSIRGLQILPRDKGALVAWTPAGVEGATYNVYSVDANGANPKKLNAEPINGSSFVVEGLTNGTQTWIGVTATVGGVESLLQMPEPSNDRGGRNHASVTPNPPVVLGEGVALSLLNIGTATPGEVSVSGTGAASVVTMKAGGWDIWEEADGFAFLAMPMAGDVEISARFVKGPTESDGGGGWELGGPMFRESADAASRFVMAQVASQNELQFKRRKVEFATPTNTGLSRDDNTARPVSTRLVRKGNEFQATYSEDNGATWKPIGDDDTSKDTLENFSSMPLVGIALSAHTEGSITEATIDNIVIKPAQ